MPLSRIWCTTSARSMTGWISNPRTFAHGGQAIASKFHINIKFHVNVEKLTEPTPTKGRTRYWTWWTWCQRSKAGRSTWPTPSPLTQPPSSSTTCLPTLEDSRWFKYPVGIYGSTNLTTQPCLFAKNHNSFLIFNLHRFLTLAQWRRLKRYLWHISWINRRSGR